MICMGLTQFSVKWIIYHKVGLKCFIHFPKCLVLSLVFVTFIFYLSRDVSWCGGILNNHIIANSLLSVPVKKF